MKKTVRCKQVLSLLLCLMMMLSMVPISANAAKEMFTTYQIDDVTIIGIDAPTAGKYFDFTAEESSQKYNIVKVAWSAQNNNSYITSPSMAPSAGTKYTVYVVLEVATANHYFKTDASRRPALSSVTVNGNTANASNTMDYSLFSVDASKYEHDTTYQKYLTVMYTFPTVEAAPIESVEFGVPALVPGERIPTTWQATGISIDGINGGANNGQVNVNKIEWFLQDGTPLAGNEVFEYGKKYTLNLTLGAVYGTSFATDANHFLSQPGKPFPVVEVKMNGKTATVLPTYDSYSNLYVVASCVLDCDTAAQINTIALTGLDVPVAGKAPDYSFIGGAGYTQNGRNDAYYKDGVSWSEVGGSYVLSDGTQAFLPGKAYQADIRIKPREGYAFATNAYGNVALTATVNGRSASVSGNKNEILITCVFPATGNIAIGQVGVTDIDAPIAGHSPDYIASYNNVNYGPASYQANTATAKNGISWYCEEENRTLQTHEKFAENKTYTAIVLIDAMEGYEFQYTSGTVNVNATVNAKKATEVTSAEKTQICLYYTFPKVAAHKHSPLKVEEIKATCSATGKQAYYFCPECGRNFEDVKCTKEISDVNLWGILEKLEHTGGKATCDNRARCKNCGEAYGELAAHNYGTSWDYKDAVGHAHKCKECGINDTIQPHGGGTAKCGQVAKCAECKAEYGEVMQHQWSAEWSYTDAKGHAHKCTVCGEHDTVQAHIGGTPDCRNKAKCSVCGTEYGKTGDHKWSTTWDYTAAAGHAHACTVKGCTEHDTVVKHTPGPEATETSSQNCTVCQYVIAPANKHEHKLSKVAEVNETCTAAGKAQHYVCDGCGKLFEDAKGTKEIADPSALVIPAAGHKESSWKSDGDHHWKECTRKGCGAVIDGTKQAHEFGKNDRCTVCKYERGAETTEAPAQTQPDETDPATPEETTAAEHDETTNDPAVSEGEGGGENTTQPSANNNTVMWIVVSASIAVAAICVIVMTVVVVKKGKQK